MSDLWDLFPVHYIGERGPVMDAVLAVHQKHGYNQYTLHFLEEAANLMEGLRYPQASCLVDKKDLVGFRVFSITDSDDLGGLAGDAFLNSFESMRYEYIRIHAGKEGVRFSVLLHDDDQEGYTDTVTWLTVSKR